ncbi:MAG: hypothetical protein HY867_13360 [Chloroflexi bacterium]|nr:hypothetical protein [Chloroflexota bacterium]
MWELIKEFAVWTGWFPITIGTVVVIFLGKYFYSREIEFKDSQIDKLKSDLEDSKQYRVDVLVQSLSERVKFQNEEMERLREDQNSSKAELTQKEKELRITLEEIQTLRTSLRQYEDQLNDLLDDDSDYCQICDPDDEHLMANSIAWGFGGDELVGDVLLVDKEGTCCYCGSTSIKCKLCGAVTGINYDSSDERFECEGGCGTIFEPLSFFGDKSIEHKIKVYRNYDE